MSTLAQARFEDRERQFLESLRARYESEGFAFTVAPDHGQLPGFLGSYRPDAIARKPGQNVAIQVKRQQAPAIQKSLQDIRRLFEGHPDWTFSVVFPGTEPLQSVIIPRAQPAAVRERIDEAMALNAAGHHRAAFVVAWSLLEAAFRSLRHSSTTSARPAEAVVQTLAMDGYIEPETERHLQPLIGLRNRIVHGDLTAEPTAADVEAVLTAAEETLAAETA